MASRLGPANPRDSTWNGAGACEMRSQARQVNFSRTYCTTFHCRGTTSSVSVTSSPSLARLVEPQHAQAIGPGTMILSRGKCAGNGLQTIPGAFAAGENHRAWYDRLRVLRLDQPRQARRGRDRDAGGRSAAMEGGAVRAREVHLPRLRADLTGSGAVPRAVARICWAEPAGHDPVREVRAASATQPPIRTLRARGSELEPVDAGRSGWRLRRPFAPALRSHPRARVCRQPRARR